MNVWVLSMLGAWLIETLVRSERPEWLAGLARASLEQTHRVALPAPLSPVDATYRAPGLERVAAIPRVEPFRLDEHRIRPAGPNAFVVTRDGWNQSVLARIDARRDGDEIVLSARFLPVAPAHLATLAILLAFALLPRAAPPQGHAFVLGLAASLCGGLVLAASRTRERARDAVRSAFPALEAQLLRTSGEEYGGPPVVEDAPSARGRLGAVVLAFFMLATVSLHRGDTHETVRAMTDRFGIDDEGAERLAPFFTEVGPSGKSVPG